MRKLASFLVALTLAVPASAFASPNAEGMEVVYCHDTARALVKRVRLRHCDGRVVTPAEAVTIHAGIEAERRQRLSRAAAHRDRQNRTNLRFKSAGAAFAVNRRGELLTSAHVVRGCDALEARNNNSLTGHRARVKAIASDADLAILRLDVTTPDILSFSGEVPADGTPLALIGYPSEGMIRRVPRLTPVLTSHAVSHPAKYGLIGVAGRVRSGNSGGPALDSRGRAVGVLKAKVNTVAAHRLTGRVLTDLGVIVEPMRILRFLDRTRTAYALDRFHASEKTGRALFEQGSRAVYRIDCLIRR